MSGEIRRRKKKKTALKIFLSVFFVVAVIFLLFLLYKRYSFTREKADLKTYFGVEGDDTAIFLNDEIMLDEEVNNKAYAKYDTVYLPLSFVKKYLNNRFYFAKDLNKILYCLPDEVRRAGDTDIHQIGNAPYVLFLSEPYLLIDYIKDFTNIRYDKYIDEENKRVYVYSDWDIENIAYLKGKESARLQGGNKSKILVDIKKGEEVKILDEMTKWVKVKTASGYIGYIRKTKIKNKQERIPTSTYIERTRKKIQMDKKPCIGFHQVLSIYGSSKLPELVKNTEGMNVIAPTWFVIKNNEGDIRSVANDAYSQWCHNKGYDVWATVNNFDLGDVDEVALFSSAKIRRKIIDKILREVDVNKLDGINLDIEGLTEDAGEDYIEFVRELSIELNKIGCIFSVDTYIPYQFNKHYNLSELNAFCDYVIIMCYDEHYSGSNSAGSVSSINYVRDGINMSLIDVDRDKLIIALPYYTRIWTTTIDGKVSSVVGGSSTIEFSALNQGLKFAFDEETCQNYGSKVTLDGAVVECWMEDALSLAYKMKEIKNANLAGTAAWKLTQERPEFFKIINMNNE